MNTDLKELINSQKQRVVMGNIRSRSQEKIERNIPASIYPHYSGDELRKVIYFESNSGFQEYQHMCQMSKLYQTEI